VPVPSVFPAERYLIGRVGPPGHRSYRCIVRYGYRDVHQDVDSFETELVETLATFIKLDASYRCSEASEPEHEQELEPSSERERRLTVIASNPLRHRASYDLQGSVGHSGASTLEMRAAAGAAEISPARKQVRFFIDSHVSSPDGGKQVAEELAALAAARESGTAFILGHSYVQCKPGSSVLKRLAVDVGYNFLRRNCRGPDVALRVPPASLLEVGMVYVL